jgi:hypothetical protein
MDPEQAPSQPLTDDPSVVECARVFKEAFNCHMPPHDFRVWDRYLFSRCTSENQVLGLVSLYDWTRNLGKPYKFDKVGKWCMDGQFARRIKRMIQTAKRSGSVPQGRIDKDLEFIKSNGEILDLGPMNLCSVDDTHKDTWLMQAKACVKFHSISWAYHDDDRMKCKEQEAYFAFGVVVWGITPEPNWVLDNVRLDVWHKMGFGVVHFKHASGLLLSRYQKRFARTCGIAATHFHYFDLNWNIIRWRMWIDLKTDSECSKLILKSLEDFFLIKDASYEPSVYRLYQMMALSDQDYRLAKMHVKVFGSAIMDYWLIGESENEETDSIAQKNIYNRVMEHIDDPMDLDYALKEFELPEFVQKVYKELKMSISQRELDLIWSDSC